MSSTLLEMKERIIDELDMDEEEWYDSDEITSDINYGIRKAHREILKLYEDYFLTYDEKTVESEQNSISYPDDIFANKVRTVVFTDADIGDKGTISYEIKSSKQLKKNVAYNMLSSVSTTGYYTYWIPFNSLADGESMNLVPQSGTAGHVQIWYIRQPRTLANDSDICDIPEFVDYVIQIAKARYYMRDGDPRYTSEKNEERGLKKDMINTLSNMKPDENTEVVADCSHYEDSV